MTLMCSRSLLLASFFVVFSSAALAADEEPIKLSAQEDHERLRGLLKISELRRGADGRKESTNPPNYDESKVGPLEKLPDPLVFNDGGKVTTPSAGTASSEVHAIDSVRPRAKCVAAAL